MVSIILPNLNTPISFLVERIDTIVDQTDKDWECIIIDGFSSNGSWDYIFKRLASDNRFRLYQRPPKGIYDAWNEGIRVAKGEFIYIATSDDTMSADFIEKMTEALFNNPDCGFAQCNLAIIDENSNYCYGHEWEKYWISQYLGKLLQHDHKRLAPHDGILHMGVQTVYTSITPLLIRKKVLDENGLFLTNCGPIADFEWGMRVSLTVSVVYISQKLATWRKHGLQATSANYNDTAEHRNMLCKLAQRALSIYKANNPSQYNRFNLSKLFYVFRRDQFYYELVSEKYRGKKMDFVRKWIFLHPKVLLDFILYKLKLKKRGFDRIGYIRKYIIELGFDKNIELLK